MPDLTDPTVLTVEAVATAWPRDDLDYWAEDNRDACLRRVGEIPTRYADAVPSNPAVRNWVGQLVTAAAEGRNANPLVAAGPSLLMLGSTGTGKTYQAWGAVRALMVSGASVRRWKVTTAADLYARMRPRHGVDPEAEFDAVAHATVLVLDDLGAAKHSDWVEEVNYRLINHRYEHSRPTLLTSNFLAKDLGERLGDRVASRLSEMTTRVVLEGPDRRRTQKGAA